MRIVITWIMVFYCSCMWAKESKTVAIVTYHAEGLPLDLKWDPDSVRSGITGSEESVIFMAEQLAQIGYHVTVWGKPPHNSRYTYEGCNPIYREVSQFDTQKERYDIAISWRMPALARELKKCAKKVYFWPHDRCFPLVLSKEQVERFDGVLWVSAWQRGEWMVKNPEFARFSTIFGNGVNPSQFFPVKKRKNPYSCIYGSNYGQGLSILLDIWPAIRKQFPKATLDIYYGWRHFGFLTEEQEIKMRRQIAELSEQGVSDHGMVGHQELNEAYSKASFWTYPCIGTETFSITALRAQISGAIPVIIQGSALVETVGSGYRCNTKEEYCDLLLSAMRQADKLALSVRQEARDFVLKNHTWQQVAKRWQQIFEQE